MLDFKEADESYDVVVAGGGISGVMAAVSAARNGAKVLIVDQNGYFGGNLTANGVGPMMTFFAGEKQVILGLGEEMIQRLQARRYSPGHVLDSTNFISYVTPFSAEGMKIVLDEMVQEAGCRVLFHTYLIGVDFFDDTVEAVYISNKDGNSRVKASVFIDATGDADLAAGCGVPYQLGRASDNAMQPMTMNMKLYNVDTQALREYVLRDPLLFPRLNRDLDVMKTGEILSFVGFDELFKAAKAAGEIHIPREDVLFFETNNPGEVIMNTTRIIEHSGVDAASLTSAEMIGRKQCEELYRFMVSRVPGFADAKIAYTGPSIGIRGTRQIKGKYTLTAEDLVQRRHFDSVVAHSGYPIDIHNPEGEGTTAVHAGAETEVKDAEFDRKIFDNYYGIPFEIMITNEFSNLLVTGRCVSATFEAQAAIRLTPTLTALGQACGVAAAIAAAANGDVRELNISELQQILLRQGSYIEL